MNQLKFKAKIRALGKASIVTIPRAYTKNDILIIGEEYTFIIKDSNQEDEI